MRFELWAAGTFSCWNFSHVVVKRRKAMTEHLMKILIVGDGNVGKSSFVHRYVNGQFNKMYKMTVGGTAALVCQVSIEKWDCTGS